MGFLARVVEALTGRRGTATAVYEVSRKTIYSPTGTTTAVGESPAVPLRQLLEVYVKDPTARAAVDYLADQAVGMGFYTTAKIPEAKELVDEFCEQVGLDEMLQATAREVVATGNSFWLKVTPERLESVRQIPLTNVSRIYRRSDGTPEAYELSTRLGRVRLRAEEVVHFRWNPINNEAFGSGLLRSLAEPLTTNAGGQLDERMPLYKMKAIMQQSMILQFQKFSAPNELWIFPNLPARELDVEREGTVAWHIKNMPPSGARWVTNQADADVKLAVAERSRGFDSYVRCLLDEYHLGLQTPVLRLFLERGFTEASAKVAASFAERKVVALQRFLKRVLERQVFWPLVEQAGFDAREANVRIHWGQPVRPQITVSDMLRAYELGAISLEELRHMLMKSGWELRPKNSKQESTKISQNAG